ncbi:MAG TPA: hypothetical protein VK157_11420 [Phycisphaerales bacterium]|nr:hypothetical protein [Phycisphaerales bacterium]
MRLGLSVVVAGLVGLPAVCVAGPDWVERGDAGSSLFTAQITTGVGTIRSITGDLTSSDRGGADLEDLYIIRIVNPGTYSFTVNALNFSPALYLFNISLAGEAFGLVGERGDGALNVVLSGNATDSTGAQVSQPGLYALAVTYSGNRPLSRTGPIFNFASEGETSGPDGQGGINPLESWDPQSPLTGGDYNIVVTGVEFADIPAPGAAAMLMTAGIVAARRRRR